MSNMSYCRFENTTQDMIDCIEHIEDFCFDKSSEIEINAYYKFLNLCKYVVNNYENKEK